MDQRAQWMEHMNIGKTDKVLLGITVAIATAAAGAVRLWMAFPTLIVGIIAAAVLIRILDSSSNNGGSSKQSIHRFGSFGPFSDGDINPATGLPMRGMYDAGGNRWMHNRHHRND
jgi:hypothetical protein